MIPRRLLAGAAAALVATTVSGPAATASAPAPGVCVPAVPCKLSATLPAGDVLGVWTAPDSARVVFLHRDATLKNHLYSAPVAGGAAAVRLDAAATQSAGFLAISADSARVLYTGIVTGGARALFSVPIGGPATAGVRLAGAVGSGFTDARISPDSRKVVYLPPSRDRLLTVPIAGPSSAAGRLTDPVVAGGSILDFAISAGSGSVVYRAVQDVAGATELYRVPLTLSPPPDPPTVKLNAPLVTGRHVLDYRLAPDDGPVVYRADQDTDDVQELYSVRLGGAGRVKISLPLPAGWIVTAPMAGGPDAGWIPPGGGRVVYRILRPQLDGQPQVRLYTVPIAGPGTASVRLDDPPPGGAADARVLSYRFTADGARVVYTMVDDDDGTTAPAYWLLSVPAAGPAGVSTVLSFPSYESEYFVLSPDGRYVLWQLFDALFRVPVAGGPAVRLSGAEVPGVPLLVDATGTRVVYEAPTSDGRDLFSVPMSGSGDRYVLTATLDAGSIDRETLTAAGHHVVYTARGHGPDARHELYSSRLVPSVLPPTR